ncbi:hypothetical protein [uncultured Roseibium sp.]|uniref:hypothetical protein n=1 Tax=uncultured Roseibium sp. TaxID=1936171 RepID=UPI0032174C9E
MKLLWWGFAAVLIVLGLATVWMPIPTGVPLLTLGGIIIIGSSRSAARMIRKHRRNRETLDKAFFFLEERAPLNLARILKRTRPRKGSVGNHEAPRT